MSLRNIEQQNEASLLASLNSLELALELALEQGDRTSSAATILSVTRINRLMRDQDALKEKTYRIPQLLFPRLFRLVSRLSVSPLPTKHMENRRNKGGRPTLASLAISEAASSYRQMKLSFNTTTSVEFGLSPPK